jgi:hypothetical protein
MSTLTSSIAARKKNVTYNEFLLREEITPLRNKYELIKTGLVYKVPFMNKYQLHVFMKTSYCSGLPTLLYCNDK